MQRKFVFFAWEAACWSPVRSHTQVQFDWCNRQWNFLHHVPAPLEVVEWHAVAVSPPFRMAPLAASKIENKVSIETKYLETDRTKRIVYVTQNFAERFSVAGGGGHIARCDVCMMHFIDLIYFRSNSSAIRSLIAEQSDAINVTSTEQIFH